MLQPVVDCTIRSAMYQSSALKRIIDYAQTPPVRFVVNSLYRLLYQISTRNRTNGVWALRKVQTKSPTCCWRWFRGWLLWLRGIISGRCRWRWRRRRAVCVQQSPTANISQKERSRHTSHPIWPHLKWLYWPFTATLVFLGACCGVIYRCFSTMHSENGG